MGQDDTLRTGAQAEEDTLMAVIEAGALPGTRIARDHADLDGAQLVLQRVTRRAAEQGLAAGVDLAREWATLPQEVHGRFMLTFDGWADDPRALVQVPCVRAFCGGLLAARQHLALRVLLDERKLPIPPEQRYEIAGGLWLVAHTLPHCWAAGGPTGLWRDMEVNEREYLRLLGGAA